nr:retrovirus-related Pol polyprotein from transposon TNT 1-94 [Tanacetum cinerariifolium]
MTTIGCILLSVGQGQSHGEVVDILNYVVNQSDYTVQTLLKAIINDSCCHSDAFGFTFGPLGYAMERQNGLLIGELLDYLQSKIPQDNNNGSHKARGYEDGHEKERYGKQARADGVSSCSRDVKEWPFRKRDREYEEHGRKDRDIDRSSVKRKDQYMVIMVEGVIRIWSKGKEGVIGKEIGEVKREEDLKKSGPKEHSHKYQLYVLEQAIKNTIAFLETDVNPSPKKARKTSTSVRLSYQTKDTGQQSFSSKRTIPVILSHQKRDARLHSSTSKISSPGFIVFLDPTFESCSFKGVLQGYEDIQDSPDDEEDTRSSHEYLNDQKEEHQARALLAKSKRFFKKGTQRFSSAKETDQTEYHKCGKKAQTRLKPTKEFEAKYNKAKAKLALLSSSASAFKAAIVKNKEENDLVSKEGARNGEWVKISMRKVDTLLEMKDNDDRKTYLDYFCIDLNYVEEQRNNLLSKHRDLVHELNACKEQLLVLKQAKLEFLTMQHVNTEILKENKNLRTELKELTKITKTWLNNPFSSEQKDIVFAKSSADDTKVSIPGVKRPWLSEAEGFILPNYDNGRILPSKSQRNTDPSVAVTDSLATEYDSADESSVCSTTLLPLKKLDGVKINEPSSAPAKGNKSSPASKFNSATAERETNLRNPQHAFKRYEACGHSTHNITNHYDTEWFKRGEALQAKKAKVLKSTRCDIRKPIWYLDSRCLRHMTGVKSHLHKYKEQPGPKVVFGDDSTCTTEGYGSIKCNGLVFAK